MKSINLAFALVFVIAIIVSSCSDSGQPINIADAIEVNYQTGPQIGIRQNLTIWIKNQTAYCVSFPSDYGIKVFAQTGDGWTEVPNLVTYIGDQPNSLKPKGDIFSERSIVVRPEISSLALTKPTNFYAVISGHLCEDETIIVEKKIQFVVAP